MQQYTVRHHKYGTLIFGPIPLFDCIVLTKAFGEEYGYDLCDAVISQRYRATVCLTNLVNSNLWRIDLELEEIKK